MSRENDLKNYENQLAALYPVVKQFPETPFNSAVLATGLGIEERKAFPILKALIEKGLLVRKYLNINVYKFTRKGLEAIKNAYRRRSENDRDDTVK